MKDFNESKEIQGVKKGIMNLISNWYACWRDCILIFLLIESYRMEFELFIQKMNSGSKYIPNGIMII